MQRAQHPLDGQSDLESVRELERLIRAAPDLSTLATLRAFLAAAPRSLVGERTAEECLAADDEKLRVLVQYMILGNSAMADLHPASREWLTGGVPPAPMGSRVEALRQAAGRHLSWTSGGDRRVGAYPVRGVRRGSHRGRPPLGARSRARRRGAPGVVRRRAATLRRRLPHDG